MPLPCSMHDAIMLVNEGSRLVMSKNAHIEELWKHMPYFLSVAKAGSFNAAAEGMRADRTTIARHIETLEELLTQKVFERHGRALRLTRYGRNLFVAGQNAEQYLGIFGLAALENAVEPERLRVSVADHLIPILSGHLEEFRREHPDILLVLDASERFADLRQFEADIAIRVTGNMPRSLTTKRIHKPAFKLYQLRDCSAAHRSYLARPDELDVPAYVKGIFPDARIGMAINGLLSLKEMIAKGAGVGILPQYLGDADDRLESCSAPLPARDLWLSLVFLPEMRNIHKIRTFVRFMETRLSRLSQSS